MSLYWPQVVADGDCHPATCDTIEHSLASFVALGFPTKLVQHASNTAVSPIVMAAKPGTSSLGLV